MARHETWSDRQRSTTVALDGHDLEVAYYDSGDGAGDEPPVLLLHGIPTWSFLWRDVVKPIEAERRVVVPDMVGYGNSDMRDTFDRSIRAQEEMIDGLRADLGIDRFDFVGHDLGGGVALRYAAHQPAAVRKLVLSNAVAYDSWPVEPIVQWGLPTMPQDNSADGLQQTLDEVYRSTLAADDPDEEFVEGMKAQWDSEEAVVSLSRNAIATNTSHTTEIDYGAVDAETLLLWGGDDEFQPVEYAELLADDIDDAELVALDGALHWVMQDRPEAYREELASFLLDGR